MIKNNTSSRIFQNEAKRNEDDEATSTLTQQDIFNWLYTRLQEFDFGDWEGMTWEAIFQLPEGKHWMDNFVHERTPNGESFVDQAERVKLFYLEKEAAFFGQRVAVVAHAGTIRSLLCYLHGTRLEDSFNRDVGYGEVVAL